MYDVLYPPLSYISCDCLNVSLDIVSFILAFSVARSFMERSSLSLAELCCFTWNTTTTLCSRYKSSGGSTQLNFGRSPLPSLFFFIFMQFSANFGQVIGLRPPLLDWHLTEKARVVISIVSEKQTLLWRLQENSLKIDSFYRIINSLEEI